MRLERASIKALRENKMSNFQTLKYRRSTEIFQPNTWFVYHDLGFDKPLIKECSSEEEAKNLVKSMLMEEIEATIIGLDETRKVPKDYLELCIEDGRGLIESVEVFFSDCSFDIVNLEPLVGDVSDDFSTEVRKLQRPYIAITDEDYAIFEKGESNYYLTTTGRVVLFGGASVKGGETKYALMPLNNAEAQKVLALNESKA